MKLPTEFVDLPNRTVRADLLSLLKHKRNIKPPVNYDQNATYLMLIEMESERRAKNIFKYANYHALIIKEYMKYLHKEVTRIFLRYLRNRC
jgi:hypothetical protein